MFFSLALSLLADEEYGFGKHPEGNIFYYFRE
jgi:hypothetical protein